MILLIKIFSFTQNFSFTQYLYTYTLYSYITDKILMYNLFYEKYILLSTI